MDQGLRRAAIIATVFKWSPYISEFAAACPVRAQLMSAI
jgi:hypothetical protein